MSKEADAMRGLVEVQGQTIRSQAEHIARLEKQVGQLIDVVSELAQWRSSDLEDADEAQAIAKKGLEAAKRFQEEQ